MKWIVFRAGMLVLMFGGFGPAAWAQVGQIGMGAAELRARLGPPHRVETAPAAAGALFTAYDALWCYEGRDAGTSFCYALEDSVVFSTTARVAYGRQPEAMAAMAAFAGEMEGKGWRVERLDPRDYLFHAAAAVFRLAVLPAPDGYQVVRTHVARPFVAEAAGVLPAALLGASLPEAQMQEEPEVAGTEQDTTAAEETPVPAEPAPAPAVEAEAAAQVLDPTRGGYTWVVASTPDRQEAERIATRYQARGFVSGVLQAELDGRPFYRVGLGQYPTRAALNAARSTLPADVPEDSWPLRL